MSLRQELMQRCIELVHASPDGLRYGQLKESLRREFDGVGPGAIGSAISGAPSERPQSIRRPERGLYVKAQARRKVRQARGPAAKGIKAAPRKASPPRRAAAPTPEWKFYKAFARWLGAIEHCDRMIVVGGNRFGGKWGTPDVFGCVDPAVDAIAGYPHTVVAGELKGDRNELIPALGQACTYKDFAHLSWLAIPRDPKPGELERLERLCLRYQVGLVLYDPANPDDPAWELRVRPMAGSPHMAELNEKLNAVKDELWGLQPESYA